MPPAARVADPTVDGLIVQGSGDTFINGLPAARVADAVACAHGPGIVLPGSSNVMINFLPAARLGDPNTCMMGPSLIVLGSPNVFIGG